jgi:hypothetical protein
MTWIKSAPRPTGLAGKRDGARLALADRQHAFVPSMTQ